MSLEPHSVKDLLFLSRRAEEMRRRRFEQIRQRSDPADQPLHDLLQELAARQNDYARALRDHEARASELQVLALDLAQADRIVLRQLPSISRGFGESLLDRDLALFFAESLEEEAARFYRVLADDAPDWESRDFFLGLAERDRGNLDHLRRVVLQG